MVVSRRHPRRAGSAPSALGDPVLVVDVGSTYTKGALVDLQSPALLARGQTPTTVGTDVLEGVDSLALSLGAPQRATVLAGSSAGGGLRLAVVGYEPSVTAEAGRRVGLTAGARVVHVAAGRLDGPGVADLLASRPDIVLVVGGTDGGNADMLLHNAARLARSRLRRSVPLVVAGNAAANPAAADLLRAAGRPVIPADNVLPRIGVLAPTAARTAIRDAFLRHVIGGKGLSRGARFARMVRAATPDAVLQGVTVLAEVVGRDVLVVDVGGATTDVYSWVRRDDHGTGAGEVVAGLTSARTVEADLGVRWSAQGVLEAAVGEGLPVSPGLAAYAARAAADPVSIPTDPAGRALEMELARLAAIVAVRRHARPGGAGDPGRDLRDVGLVVGSGGVIRHAQPAQATALLSALAADDAGGWRTPRAPRLGVDTAYLLVVVGLLAQVRPDVASALARALADELLD